ncbi:hypothetical protein [uncultured Aquimarina sp.]|uniref:hypothetical protein n=1 Tax=uncultured Aquimarina sp. TaxID=575652 RepID=UPI00261E2444|nr:hypothetical protein [uncultured Aquimarina sp.]
MRLTIAYNKEKNGIELLFVPKLSDKILEGYLIDLGFKKSNSKGGMWYVTDRPSYNSYVKTLQEAFNNGIDPNTIKVEPSYNVDRDLIDHYQFSLVNVKIDDDKEEDKGVDYVIFDDLKKTALDIATRFAKAKYGSRLNSISASPRNFKRRARNAFDEGRIITGDSDIKNEDIKIIETKKTEEPKTQPKWLKTKEAYLLDSGGTEKKLKDDEYIDEVAYEHEQLLLEALLAGNTIPTTILEGYPKLTKPNDFGYSYSALDFESKETFLEILKGIGNSGEYYTARYPENNEKEKASAYVWKGKDVDIVTSGNPLLQNGYASRTGLQGERDTVIKLINTINATQEFGGELGLNSIGFSSLILSDISYSYTSYTNENDVYTIDNAGNRYKVYTIPFPLKIKFEATIRLVQDEQDQYLYGLRVSNTLSGFSGYSFLPTKGDGTYSSKEEALEAAILQVLDGVQYDHTEALRMGASEALKKAYKKTILAIYDFADSIKIKLPEEKSKAILPLSVDEEESIEKEQATKITLNTLNEDVEQLVDELRELETNVDDKGVAFKIGNAKIDLDEALKTSKGKQLIYKLRRLYSSLAEIAETVPGSDNRNRFENILERLRSKIGVKPFKYGSNNRFTIIQKHTTLDDKLLSELQSFIELHKNALHISYLKSKKGGALSILKVRISSDRDIISFLHKKEDNTLKIDGLNPHDEGMVSYNGGAVPMERLKRAIKYMLANPKTLRVRPAEVYRLSDYKGAIQVDIEHNGQRISNVLMPEGVDSTFDFGRIKEKSKNELKEEFPMVFDIQDDTLIFTIPSQLFTLSQFQDLYTLGIQVDKQVLDAHWLHYGDRLFELLGYPTDLNYPYVNLTMGYYQVTTLGEIIKVNRNNKHSWGNAIKGYRPIANLETALQLIDDKIALFQKELDVLKRTDDKAHRHSKAIEHYQEQRKKIQDYIDNYGNPFGISQLKVATDISSTETSKRQVSNKKVYLTDITRYDTFIPNVLIPKVINSPFDSGGFYIQDAKKIQEKAPHLLQVSDERISELDAKTMFELSQMAHPNDYGFSVSRSALLREWERRGQSLFEELGYPTNLQYPYVNISSGYGSVYPLEKFINLENEQNEWWHVIELYRPIADLHIALQYLDKEIESIVKVRDTFTNPKTGKPKSKKEDKEQYRSLGYKIESLERSKLVIQHYLDLKKEDASTTEDKDTFQEVAQAETTEKGTQDYFSNIIVPERVIAPFDKGYIPPEVALQLKEQFFYLFEYTYRNVHWASPVELFMLLQFINLKESDISVKKETLYRIWEKEGQSLFNQLAYPTDPKYPYINLEKGFLEIVPLEVIISKLPDVTIWWSAVKHYRPIADVEKALKVIIEKQNILAEKFEKYKDTNKTSVKGTTSANEDFHNLSSDITLLKHSRNHLETYVKSIKNTSKEISNSKDEPLSPEDFLLIPVDEADRIRKEFKAKGFRVSFTGKEAFTRSLSIVELAGRSGYVQIYLDEKIEKEFNKWITILEKELKKLAGKKDKKSKQSKQFRLDRISALKMEVQELRALVHKEHTVFCDELFLGLIVRAKEYGYVFDGLDIADFRDYIVKNIFEGRILENYPDQSIGKTARILIDDYFSAQQQQNKTTNSKEDTSNDYLDKVVAIMHDHYINNKRVTKKGVEALLTEANVPNMGMLWEAVELSWLLWYKMLYNRPGAFEIRLQSMTTFWNKVQPTYAYSDSSKEQYKQYSTSCPISAMIAQYTQMSDATRTFEPSAGNGLLVLGADPAKTHVNEIDSSRRKSLEFQGFKTITHLNAAEPFPEEYTKSFDVVVTNPPFDKWSADKFDKGRMVKKYFDGNIGLNNHLRLEHLMSGLALHTMKDSGKAALIIKGHIKFTEEDGYMATYKPFFNWLYSRYVVDDVINMNAYKLYNKQGAVTEMMLVLIGGRKPKKSKKVAPNRDQAASLADIADSFEELWERVASHIKTPLEIEIEKLKIALGYDIF